MQSNVIRIHHRADRPEESHAGLGQGKGMASTAVVSDESGQRWIAYDSDILPDEVMNGLLGRLAESEYDWESAWKALDQAIRGFGAFQYDNKN